MAQGDVTAEIVDADATAIDTAVTALRVSAADHWLMCSLAQGKQVMIVHVEEA